MRFGTRFKAGGASRLPFTNTIKRYIAGLLALAAAMALGDWVTLQPVNHGA